MRGRPAGRGKDSNLFKIDFDQIGRILADANANLTRQIDETLQRADDLPIAIENASDAEKFQNIIREIQTLVREVARARLADGRPFTEAAKVVKKWFSKPEKILEKKELFLSNCLREFVVQNQITSHTSEIDHVGAESALGVPVSGDLGVTVGEDNHEELDETPIDVVLEWEVQSFDRALLPLEDLREFFTESSINLALKKHLARKGPNLLEGVKYSQRLGKL
jgi:hypothetical protein